VLHGVGSWHLKEYFGVWLVFRGLAVGILKVFSIVVVIIF
jgi:hypothetical protein